jgi:hypothetical protein
MDVARLFAALREKDAAERAPVFIRNLAPFLSCRSLEAAPLWSGVCDDCSPYELSVAFRRETNDIRLLLEAQSDPASVDGYWAAACRLQDELARTLHAELEPFRRIAADFAPTDPHALFGQYQAIEWRADGQSLVKVYLNPAARGAQHTAAALGIAAERFNVAKAWQKLAASLDSSARPVLLSIDLCRAPRFKVYVRRWDADPIALNAEYNRLSGTTGDDLVRFAGIITGNARRLSARPIFVVYHLSPERELPSKLVLDIPLFPFADSDATAYHRIVTLLEELRISPVEYQRAVRALCPGPLQHGAGFHSYVSLQRQPSGYCVTVYFSPRLYAARYGYAALDPKPNFYACPVQIP